jgi:hypothetical protein
MLSFGRLCKSCVPGKCREKPCPDYQPFMACVVCNGNRCQACDFRGEVPITGCPHRTVTQTSWEILRIANLIDKGFPPVVGGSLDQSKPLMDAVEFVWGDEASNRQEIAAKKRK